MPQPDDLAARFNALADAAIAADTLSQRLAPFYREGQEAQRLVAPLARRALNIGRDLLRPPSIEPNPRPRVVAPPGDPQPHPLRPDAPLASSSSSEPPSGKVHQERIVDDVALTLREARELWEREWIAARLRDHRGNVTKTAAAIGMERVALLRKIHLLRIPVIREPGRVRRRRKTQSNPVSN